MALAGKKTVRLKAPIMKIEGAYVWMDKVVVLDWYDDWMVSSPSWETRVPAVVMLKQMQL